MGVVWAAGVVDDAEVFAERGDFGTELWSPIRADLAAVSVFEEDGCEFGGNVGGD